MWMLCCFQVLRQVVSEWKCVALTETILESSPSKNGHSEKILPAGFFLSGRNPICSRFSKIQLGRFGVAGTRYCPLVGPQRFRKTGIPVRVFFRGWDIGLLGFIGCSSFLSGGMGWQRILGRAVWGRHTWAFGAGCVGIYGLHAKRFKNCTPSPRIFRNSGSR